MFYQVPDLYIMVISDAIVVRLFMEDNQIWSSLNLRPGAQEEMHDC